MSALRTASSLLKGFLFSTIASRLLEVQVHDRIGGAAELDLVLGLDVLRQRGSSRQQGERRDRDFFI